MDNLAEEFRPVAGYEKHYEVSNLGRVRSLKAGKVLKSGDNGIGYLIVGLNANGRKSFLVHRLVAIAFIDNPNNLPKVNHKDGIKSNCEVSNLEWCTQKQNIEHSIKVLGKDRKQTNKDKVGALNWNSKAVNQYDKQGNLINSFGSTTEAFRNTGIDFSSIQKVCLGKRSSAGGYSWAYSIQD